MGDDSVTSAQTCVAKARAVGVMRATAPDSRNETQDQQPLARARFAAGEKVEVIEGGKVDNNYASLLPWRDRRAASEDYTLLLTPHPLPCSSL